MAKKKSSIKSDIKSNITSNIGAVNRQFRDKLTRVGITTKPIKGADTNAKQWNRWTP